MTYFTEALNTKAGIFSTVYNFIIKLIDDYKAAKRVHITVKELNKLSDAELLDIGIARCDIYRIAMEANNEEKRAK